MQCTTYLQQVTGYISTLMGGLISHAGTTVCTNYNPMQFMLQHMNDPSLVFALLAAPDPQFRECKLTRVLSGQVRELTGKMLIPSSRIRLLDMLGHGKFSCYFFILHG